MQEMSLAWHGSDRLGKHGAPGRTGPPARCLTLWCLLCWAEVTKPGAVVEGEGRAPSCPQSSYKAPASRAATAPPEKPCDTGPTAGNAAAERV